MPVYFETQAQIGTITIEGSTDRNPITPDMYGELIECLMQLDNASAVRAIMLRGAGEMHFSCGADPEAVARSLPSSDEVLEDYWYRQSSRDTPDWVARQDICKYRTRKPVIAAIVGDCLGSALVIVGAHSDLRIAGSSAHFGFSDLCKGSGGSSAVVSRLARQIGRMSLFWILETGQEIDAEAALSCNLVNEVVADDVVFERAMKVTEMTALLPPNRVQLEKLMLQRLETLPYEDAVSFVADISQLM